MTEEKHNDLYSGTIADIGLPGSGYFERTSRPIYALVYLLPFVIIYEVLVLAINPQLFAAGSSNLRGGVVSFVWIQNILGYLGMDVRAAWLAAPAVVVIILLVLQFTSGQSWRLVWPDFIAMTGESIMLALPLIVLALVINRNATAVQKPAADFSNEQKIVYCQAGSAQQQTNETKPPQALTRPFAMDMITGIGAGIYEELIFRLILICGFMIFFETLLGISHNKAIMISILLSAVLFSLHHHVIFLDGEFIKKEVFTLPRFVFRAIAGIYFAAVFAVRGFGIAAGAHIFYDLIAVLVNAIFFE